MCGEGGCEPGPGFHVASRSWGDRSCQAGMWVCGLSGPHLRPDLPADLIPTPVGAYPPCPQGFHSLGAENQGLLRLRTHTAALSLQWVLLFLHCTGPYFCPNQHGGCISASLPLLSWILCLAWPWGFSQPILILLTFQGFGQCHLRLEALLVLGFPLTSFLPASLGTVAAEIFIESSPSQPPVPHLSKGQPQWWEVCQKVA